MLIASRQLLNKGKGPNLEPSGYKLGIGGFLGLPKFKSLTVIVGW